ncbi:MAG: hypothetical protein KDB90_18590, partial [Planctomycetes bacterium]|nr:hypothetical protein [Planctomycetota bacterium]
MADQVELVQNDTLPSIFVAIDAGAEDEVVDLTDAIARMYFVPVGDTTVKATIVGVPVTGKFVLQDDGTEILDESPPYDVAGSGGRIRFDWPAGVLSDSGYFDGEIEVTFSDTSILTAFNKIRFYVR